MQIHVELMLLEMLEQRPARAMHHALREPSRPRAVHHVERVIEGEPFEPLGCRGAAGEEVIPADRLRELRLHIALRRRIVKEGHDDQLRHTRQRRDDLRAARHAIDPLPRVVIAIGDEQHLRGDLPEAIEHPAHAEIGRTGRPDGADARRAERPDHRLGDVGEEPHHAVTRSDTGGTERTGTAAHRISEFDEGQRPAAPPLVARDDRRRPVATPQEILREVEPRPREPLRPGSPMRRGHAVAIDQHRVPWQGRPWPLPSRCRDHPGQPPELRPEPLGLTYRPGVPGLIGRIGGGGGRVDRTHRPTEPGERTPRRRLAARGPEGEVGGRHRRGIYRMF